VLPTCCPVVSHPATPVPKVPRQAHGCLAISSSCNSGGRRSGCYIPHHSGNACPPNQNDRSDRSCEPDCSSNIGAYSKLKLAEAGSPSSVTIPPCENGGSASRFPEPRPLDANQHTLPSSPCGPRDLHADLDPCSPACKSAVPPGTVVLSSVDVRHQNEGRR
jgi:hypothetical protein